MPGFPAKSLQIHAGRVCGCAAGCAGVRPGAPGALFGPRVPRGLFLIPGCLGGSPGAHGALGASGAPGPWVLRGPPGVQGAPGASGALVAPGAQGVSGALVALGAEGALGPWVPQVPDSGFPRFDGTPFWQPALERCPGPNALGAQGAAGC